MTTATLIQSADGFSIEFCNMITGAPTWDMQAIVALLAALGVRNLDLRINDELDEMEMLLHHADVIGALRKYRQGPRTDRCS